MKNRISQICQLLGGALLSVLLVSCNGSGSSKTPDDTPTSGSIKITVDESFQPIIDSQINVFQHLYKYAKINASYKSEGKAIQDLLQDSARLIIIPRQLTEPEMKSLEQNSKLTKSAIRITKIAYDGIALIVNPENQDTLLSTNDLKRIFTGEVTTWNQLDPKSKLGNITIVFDNNNSSTVRFVEDSITGRQPMTTKAYASNSNPAVIDYVAKNKNAIGVIGVNWISDFDDPKAISFTDRIRVAAIGNENMAEADYVQPLQGYLAQKNYPLMRELYVISREARAGLGTGFASFVAGDKGQRIILKSGLVPARGVIRLVQTKR